MDRHPENREGCTISKKSQAQGGVRCSGEEDDGGPGSGRPASTGRNPGQMGGPPHSARVSSLFSLCPSAPGGKGGVLTLPLPGTPPSSPVQPPQGAPRQLPKLLLPELHGGCAHAGPLPIPPPAGPGGRVRDPGVRPGPARPRSSAWGESGCECQLPRAVAGLNVGGRGGAGHHAHPTRPHPLQAGPALSFPSYLGAVGQSARPLALQATLALLPTLPSQSLYLAFSRPRPWN